MTALIVIGAIVLVIALLLNIKLRAEVKFYGGELDFKVKYLWITVFPLKVREKKQRRGKKSKDKPAESGTVTPKEDKAGTADTAEESGGETADNDTLLKGDTGEKKEKKKLSENIEKLGDLIEKAKIVWSFSKKWLSHIFKHIYLRDLVIDFTVAGEDAYKTAMTYGSVNAVTYGAISAASALFSTKIKTVDIVCDFEGKRSVFDGEVKIAIAPATVLAAAFGILFGLLKNLGKLKGKKTKTEKGLA